MTRIQVEHNQPSARIQARCWRNPHRSSIRKFLLSLAFLWTPIFLPPLLAAMLSPFKQFRVYILYKCLHFLGRPVFTVIYIAYGKPAAVIVIEIS